MSFMDPVSMLKELAEEATALKINLNGEITKESQTTHSRGSNGVVYGGTRHSSGTRVVIKVLHPGLSSNANEETIKVSYQITTFS